MQPAPTSCLWWHVRCKLVDWDLGTLEGTAHPALPTRKLDAIKLTLPSGMLTGTFYVRPCLCFC